MLPQWVLNHWTSDPNVQHAPLYTNFGKCYLGDLWTSCSMHHLMFGLGWFSYNHYRAVCPPYTRNFCCHFTYMETLWKLWNEAGNDLIPCNGTQWKCFVPDTPLFMTIYGSLNIRWFLCVAMCHWLRNINLYYIGGSKGLHRCSPGPISFIFMEFSAKNLVKSCPKLRPPPSGKLPWIYHCLNINVNLSNTSCRSPI